MSGGGMGKYFHIMQYFQGIKHVKYAHFTNIGLIFFGKQIGSFQDTAHLHLASLFG